MSTLSYTYEEVFQRNIGVFSLEEQAKVKNLKIAIAGAGGLGGPVAIILARLGVGEIRIADPDTFEPSNVNRQFGAYVDTIGKNKAIVIAEEMKRINPFMKIVCWDFAVNSTNVEEFLDGVDGVVDAIDFYAVVDEIALHRQARKNNQWIFSGQNAGTLFTIMNYSPKGKSFEELYIDEKGVNIKKIIEGMFPILPDEATPEAMDKILSGEMIHIPALASSPPLGGGFVVEEIIKALIRGKEILSAPDLFAVDVKNLRISKFIDGKVKRISL